MDQGKMHRLKSLIALAVNSGAAENESRNAAVAAFKMMHENKMLESILSFQFDPNASTRHSESYKSEHKHSESHRSEQKQKYKSQSRSKQNNSSRNKYYSIPPNYSRIDRYTSLDQRAWEVSLMFVEILKYYVEQNSPRVFTAVQIAENAYADGVVLENELKTFIPKLRSYLMALKEDGILESQRGPGGGYYLHVE